jgi:hypothetical protein
MIEPSHEALQHGDAPGFADSVTFAFADPQAEVYGSARIGIVPGEPASASALALIFDGSELVAATTAAAEIAAPDWSQLEAGDLRTVIEAPLERWQVAVEGGDGGFELTFAARGAPIELGAGDAAGRTAGLTGYEQLCAVHGSARTPRGEVAIDCAGQRGHQWGAPDWERLELARTVTAWTAPGSGVSVAAVRPAGVPGHEQEALSAFLVQDGTALPVADPRLSTTLDGEGRQRRAGLELWLTGEEDEYPRRLAGEAVCGTTLELGRLQLDAAFFRWRGAGGEAVGRYDVLRRR